jgi:hypothetical protein
MHLACPDSASTSLYTAPIIFDRNAHQVPGIVCVADVLWCTAGLSGLYPGSTISPPTSVYSVPLELADRVGGWDTGPEVISEDLHMYLECFFALNDHLTSRTVRSPVSQTHVTGPEGVGLVGYVGGVSARYRQALQHMWGSLDSGYALKKCVELWRRRRRSSCLYRIFMLPRTKSPTSYFLEWKMMASWSTRWKMDTLKPCVFRSCLHIGLTSSSCPIGSSKLTSCQPTQPS